MYANPLHLPSFFILSFLPLHPLEETKRKYINMKMAWNKLIFVFILVAVSPLIPQRAVGDLLSPLSPLLSPLLNGLCDVVECGKGKCHVSSNQTFGFACECDPGWSQFHIGDHCRFLPCIIPKCSINYSCTNISVSPAPTPSPTNLSLFDSCKWAYCGGGKCSQTSAYEHKCVCNEGYSNLFNASAFPCYKDCSLGADCTNLGINLSNSTSTSPPPSASDNHSSAGDYSALKNSMCLLTLIISLTTYRLM